MRLRNSNDTHSDGYKFKQHYSYVDKFDSIMTAIADNIRYRFGEDCGIIVAGESGTGKTTLSKRFLQDNCEKDSEEKDGVFGIYVEICGSGFEALYEDMLEQLHCKNPKLGSVASKKRRVIELINALDVKVVFIDEAQEGLPGAVLPSSGYIKLLKEFTNKTNASWVLLGPEKVKSIADIDEQMSERFTRTLTLKAFDCRGNENTEELMEFIIGLLVKLPRKVPFFQCLLDSMNETGSDFEYKDNVDYENLFRFLLATKGRARRIARLLSDCIDDTCTHEKITANVLAKTYEKKYRNDIESINHGWINPFKLPKSKVIEQLKLWGLYA
tara:strand:+ start:9400 stop:10383 length:984 start_codon:yes stop_codon:yes gene_type:complete